MPRKKTLTTQNRRELRALTQNADRLVNILDFLYLILVSLNYDEGEIADFLSEFE